MKNIDTDQFDMRPHLEAYWLRPESGFWDAIAAKYLGDQLRGKTDILELGIGNGYFSFLMLGGKFKPEYDWFYNVDTQDFWNNADIYDHDSGLTISDFILKTPETRIRFGLDHKKALLNQASKLGFVDEIIEFDGNDPLPELSFTTAYSNMLYWLEDPLRVIDGIGAALPKGGELITVFPNSDFYKSCTSYSVPGELMKLINKGRSSHIMWHMDLADFAREIERRGIYELAFCLRYLSPLTLKIWDIGFRPLSIPLIKMANSLTPKNRLEIKQEWCDTLLKFALPLLENELEQGNRNGGYILAVLKKK